MPTVRMYLTANEDSVRAVINQLSAVEGVEHVEEVADEMPHMDDADSSSADLTDDIGPGMHAIEVEAGNDYTAQNVRDAAVRAARELEVAVEFDDES